MVIVVEGGAVHMNDPSDFKSFKVVVDGDDATPLEAVGRLEDTDEGAAAWIRVDAVHNLAGSATEVAGWAEGFAEMLEYARTKGWLDESGTEIQAHVEYQ